MEGALLYKKMLGVLTHTDGSPAMYPFKGSNCGARFATKMKALPGVCAKQRQLHRSNGKRKK
jgi:hypothetical protein